MTHPNPNRPLYLGQRAGDLAGKPYAGFWNPSLAPLGEPDSFVATGPARLRGGFVNRNYRVSYEGRQLTIVTYAEQGGAGRFEQYLVMPSG